MTGKTVYGLTDGNGQAEIEYYQDPGSGSDTVTASISDSDYVREVTFRINGASVRVPSTGGGTTTPPPTTTNPSLTLSQSTISGAVNSSADITATVRDSNQNPVPGVQVPFSVNGVAVVVPTINSLGQATASIILPSGGGTLTVSSGYGSDSATITGTGTQADTGTGAGTPITPVDRSGIASEIEIVTSSDQLTGEVNRRLGEDLSVQVFDVNGDIVSNQLVIFTVTRGSGSPSTAGRDQ